MGRVSVWPPLAGLHNVRTEYKHETQASASRSLQWMVRSRRPAVAYASGSLDAARQPQRGGRNSAQANGLGIAPPREKSVVGSVRDVAVSLTESDSQQTVTAWTYGAPAMAGRSPWGDV